VGRTMLLFEMKFQEAPR